MLGHLFIPNTQQSETEAETSVSSVSQGWYDLPGKFPIQPELYKETLSKKQKCRKKMEKETH